MISFVTDTFLIFFFNSQNNTLFELVADKQEIIIEMK